MLLLSLRSLAGNVYGLLAQSRLDRLPDTQVEAAAGVAAALAPWNSKLTALHGWTLAEAGNPSAARQAYYHALAWAPADPLLWDEYALALAREGEFDERLAFATRRALALAPNSPAVRASIAAMGDAYWDQGTEDLRALWHECQQRRSERR